MFVFALPTRILPPQPLCPRGLSFLVGELMLATARLPLRANNNETTTPGSLNPQARKDLLIHAHAPHTD